MGKASRQFQRAAERAALRRTRATNKQKGNAGLVDILLSVIFPLFIAIGLIAMGATSPAEFIVARLGFILAAIDLGGRSVTNLLCTTGQWRGTQGLVTISTRG
jgi:hypothetical protein